LNFYSTEPETAKIVFIFPFAPIAKYKICDSVLTTSKKRAKKYWDIDYSSQKREICQICCYSLYNCIWNHCIRNILAEAL